MTLTRRTSPVPRVPAVLATISWRPLVEIHLGPLSIKPHGVLIAVGFLVGARLMLRRTRAAGIDDERVWRVLTWSLVAGLIGMRVWWAIGHWSELHSWIEVIAVWHGGMTLFGGLLTAIPVGLLVARRKGLPLLAMLDMAAPSLAIAIAIGRLSDLIVGDHLGTPTTMPWGFRYVGSDHPFAGAPAIGDVVHPVALYDMLLTALLFVVLIRFLRTTRAPGSAIALFAIWYATERIVLDFFRTDSERSLGLTGTQLVSIALVTAILAALTVRWRTPSPVAHG
jgi:phosphatidylglycerol:prolipoprotein diacylglycerol transferase